MILSRFIVMLWSRRSGRIVFLLILLFLWVYFYFIWLLGWFCWFILWDFNLRRIHPSPKQCTKNSN